MVDKVHGPQACVKMFSVGTLHAKISVLPLNGRKEHLLSRTKAVVFIRVAKGGYGVPGPHPLQTLRNMLLMIKRVMLFRLS